MKKQKEISLLKGLLAGVAGGLAGSAAKVLAEKLIPPRPAGEPAPPRIIIERVDAGTPGTTPGPAKQVATHAIHWGFGTLLGAGYGVAAEVSPQVTGWRGAVFGLTVNRLAHDRMLPGMGIVEPPADQPAQERVSEWVTHVVYGVTTDLVRRAVRKRL